MDNYSESSDLIFAKYLWQSAYVLHGKGYFSIKWISDNSGYNSNTAQFNNMTEYFIVTAFVAGFG